jgi:hypothetical protein
MDSVLVNRVNFFYEAFNNKDVVRIKSMCRGNVEFRDADGAIHHGDSKVEKALVDIFSNKKLWVNPQEYYFTDHSVAICECNIMLDDEFNGNAMHVIEFDITSKIKKMRWYKG